MNLVAQGSSVLKVGYRVINASCGTCCNNDVNLLAALRHYLKHRYLEIQGSFVRQKVRVYEYVSLVPSVIACVLAWVVLKKRSPATSTFRVRDRIRVTEFLNSSF